jgi:hypothetical protein
MNVNNHKKGFVKSTKMKSKQWKKHYKILRGSDYLFYIPLL